METVERKDISVTSPPNTTPSPEGPTVRVSWVTFQTLFLDLYTHDVHRETQKFCLGDFVFNENGIIL